jgi:hypothetical protein
MADRSFQLSRRVFKPAPSPKPRQKPKFLAAHRYIFSVNALAAIRRGNTRVKICNRPISAITAESWRSPVASSALCRADLSASNLPRSDSSVCDLRRVAMAICRGARLARTLAPPAAGDEGGPLPGRLAVLRTAFTLAPPAAEDGRGPLPGRLAGTLAPPAGTRISLVEVVVRCFDIFFMAAIYSGAWDKGCPCRL